jgi:flagellar hook-associated protein 3 FlgL
MINATGNRMTLEIRRQSNMAQQISDNQVNISTGKRLQRASDDPVAAARVAQIRQAQSDQETWANNLTIGTSLTAQADGVLRNMNDRIARAQELVVAGASGSLSAADRGTIALELRGISDEISGYASTQSSLGQPLFSSGIAPSIRFNENSVFAPVPSQNDVFQTGGVALGQIIQDAADAVASGNATQIGSALTSVQSVVSHTADVAADIGLRAARIDRLQETSSLRKIESAAERSALEDTNLTEAISQLNAQTITLEAAQAAFARINRRTLFDILG